MNKKTPMIWKIITVAILVAVAISLFFINNANNREYKELENKKKSITVQKQKKVKDGMDAKEVSKYKDLLKHKFDQYLTYDLPEGVMNTDNTGVQAIKSKVTPNSGKIFDEDSSKKEFIKYYSKADVKVSNIAATKSDDGSVEVMALVDTKFDGRTIADNYRLLSITFDKDNMIIGGKIYGEQ